MQQQGQMFECNFGPNYHPTFEVFLNVNIEEFKMGVLDRKKREVRSTRRIVLLGPCRNTDTTVLRVITEFVDSHREALLARVNSVMAIADCLRGKNMIIPVSYRDVHAAEPQHRKMRLLYNVLDSGGPVVKAEFYSLLKDKEPCLVRDLEARPL